MITPLVEGDEGSAQIVSFHGALHRLSDSNDGATPSPSAPYHLLPAGSRSRLKHFTLFRPSRGGTRNPVPNRRQLAKFLGAGQQRRAANERYALRRAGAKNFALIADESHGGAAARFLDQLRD